MTFRPFGGPFPFAPYRLLGPLQRWNTIEDEPWVEAARPQAWDPEEGEWIDHPSSPDVGLFGDFFRGYGFADDLVLGFQDPQSGRHLAFGCGHFFVRGKIATDSSGFPIELNSGGLARLDVWVWDHDGNEWVVSDPLVRVTFREAIGLEEPMATGDLLLCTWHEQAQQWIATHAPCPEE